MKTLSELHEKIKDYVNEYVQNNNLQSSPITNGEFLFFLRCNLINNGEEYKTTFYANGDVEFLIEMFIELMANDPEMEQIIGRAFIEVQKSKGNMFRLPNGVVEVLEKKTQPKNNTDIN